MSGLGRALGGFARQNAIALVALFVALGGGAYAATGGGGFLGPTGTINGCVASKGGALRVLKPGKRCPRHTTALRFNVAGRPGVAGPTGSTGVAGAPGAPGAAGCAWAGWQHGGRWRSGCARADRVGLCTKPEHVYVR